MIPEPKCQLCGDTGWMTYAYDGEFYTIRCPEACPVPAPGEVPF